MPETTPARPTPADVNAMRREAFPGSGNECVEIGDDHAVARYVATAADVRPGGYISGPTQFGLADAVLWYGVFAAIGRIEPMALTSELSIRYLRPAIGEVLWARATVVSVGRRNVVGSVSVWVDDRPHKPTAVAQGTYVLPAP
ncbi:MAG: PaaI family thioesterase [Ilumatobacteraceae bacterium]